MPELPDLEAIKAVLNSKIAGVKIVRVEMMQPLVIRQPDLKEFEAVCTGNRFIDVNRRGKFLLFNLESKHILAMHFMLTGRLQYCGTRENRKPKTCFIFHLEDGKQLRYFDSKLMGKIYLVEKGRFYTIPRWNEMGPDALDDDMTLDVFRSRIKPYSGQIKNVLLNDTFLTGIGNAYADEILFEAGIYPFWPGTSLSHEEVGALYNAMRSVLIKAVDTVSNRMRDDITTEVRDFLKVHRRGGKPCPACGGPISQVQANRRITSFCRNCQKA
ncbi:MAG: Fpg/Nei family DNA glycosylase [Chloroflexi bacterium]|nr:Fpg/Nei family DNA glycosylase [Chloroflexota bacterium]